MQLTLRSYSDAVRKNTLESIRRMTKHLGLAAGLPEAQLPEVTVLDESTPAAYNDPKLTSKLTNLFEKLLGSENIINLKPEMVGEDFGRYGQVAPKIPSLMYRLGTVNQERYQQSVVSATRLPTLHSANFAPDPEPTIKTGVLTMSEAALLLLKKN